MNTAQQVNILGREFKANPFLLARMRAEHPVCRVTLPDKTPVWLVTRYEDAKTLARTATTRNSARLRTQLKTRFSAVAKCNAGSGLQKS